jgi:hypothetical protein
MNRWRLVVLLVVGLAVWLLSSSPGMWAAPGMDRVRQTVPTRTPTPGPGPPTSPTPTEERVEDTPAPLPPTATHTLTAEPTASPTTAAALSPTATSSVVAPPTTAASATPVPVWDFGDAPDPAHFSLLARDGARHSVVEYEWLGEAVDQEQDSRQIDQDLHDDGVEMGELMTCTEASLEVKVTIQSRDDVEHPYDGEHLLYLNVLVDWDGDGSWAGRVSCPEGMVASEWAVRNFPIDVSLWPDGATSALVPLQLPTGLRVGQTWARFTLSYGEVVSGDDWDGRGAFTFGETEDHLVTISLAPTPTVEEASRPAVATPTPVAGVGVLMGTSILQPVLCFGVSLLLGIALVALLVAAKRRDWRILTGGLILIVLLVGGSLYYALNVAPSFLIPSPGSPTTQPTPRERLIPTATQTEAASAQPAGTAEVSVSPAPDSTVVSTIQAAEPEPPRPTATSQFFVATPAPVAMAASDRFGFGVAIGPVGRYAVDQLHAGWYVNWTTDLNPLHPGGMEYAQMIRVQGSSYHPNGQDLETVIRSNPGSLWIVGNEPDVIWQDNATPAEYARVYHEVYGLLKSVDPTCQVAVAGVSQATPLRLQYLDMILEAYRDLYGEMMPVDVWNVHGFILREERGSWGVEIPPGLSVDQGRLFEIDEHDDMEIFDEQIMAFRRWMKERGERNKPLIVSEYGILMPEEYGFPYEKVREFMYATFDYFMTATDQALGYPADGNRLVQRWAWYSLSDTNYPTGNLFDPDTGRITPLGLAYGSYTSSH